MTDVFRTGEKALAKHLSSAFALLVRLLMMQPSRLVQIHFHLYLEINLCLLIIKVCVCVCMHCLNMCAEV